MITAAQTRVRNIPAEVSRRFKYSQPNKNDEVGRAQLSWISSSRAPQDPESWNVFKLFYGIFTPGFTSVC